MWVQIIVFIATQVLSYLLTPKPKVENAKAATLDDVDVPIAEVGIEIPVLFGTREIKGANVVWYGDLRAVPIRKKGGKK
jgi:hypothetical protein